MDRCAPRPGQVAQVRGHEIVGRGALDDQVHGDEQPAKGEPSGGVGVDVGDGSGVVDRPGRDLLGVGRGHEPSAARSAQAGHPVSVLWGTIDDSINAYCSVHSPGGS